MSDWRSISKTKHSYTEPEFQTITNSPLGVLDLLHVGALLGGSNLESRMVLGHGWEERGSSKVIRLSFLRSKVKSVFINFGCGSVQGS